MNGESPQSPEKFIIYADTTGTLNTKDNDHYLAVGAIVIHESDKALLDQKVNDFKRTLYPGLDPTKWKMRGSRFCAKKMPPHDTMNNEQVCREAFEWLVDFILEGEIVVILHPINKRALYGKTRHGKVKEIWPKFFRLCDKFLLSKPKGTVGRIVHDRDDDWERLISRLFDVRFKNKSMSSKSRLASPMLFDGPDAINMLAIADMVASLMRQAAFTGVRTPPQAYFARLMKKVSHLTLIDDRAGGSYETRRP